MIRYLWRNPSLSSNMDLAPPGSTAQTSRLAIHERELGATFTRGGGLKSIWDLIFFEGSIA